MTQSGGSGLNGTAFRLALDGTITLLHSFSGTERAGGRLVEDAAGNLYGVSPQGGATGMGAVFRIAPGGAFDVLYTFTGGSDGITPHSRLLIDGAGNLYGATSYGGVGGAGTFYKLAPGGALTVMRGLRLSNLNGDLALDLRDHLFGTTLRGGSTAVGSVFALSTVTGAYEQLHSFGGTDGDLPSGALALDAFGRLYGTTSFGGMNGGGVAYRLDPRDGSFAVLHDFNSPDPPPDGSWPLGGLAQDAAGNLYGTAQSGGAGFSGALFRMAQEGTSYEILHDFGLTPDDGYGPLAAVTLDTSGNVYGTASGGGLGGSGVVFKWEPSGNYSILHGFEGIDGAYPGAALTLDAAGNLYGTTPQGGTSNFGNVFSIATDGTFTVLHDFAGPDGAGPQGGVVLDALGNAYGTTRKGGAADRGTVFKLEPDGTHTVLYSFQGIDGSHPLGRLLLAGDGAYGTTSGGGRLSGGVVFRLTLP